MQGFRQGDVWVVPISDKEGKEAIEGLEEVERDKGRVVLAYGEVTGHAHAVANNTAVLFGMDEALRFLKIREQSMLRHEEHGEIPLAKGYYKVIRQREHTSSVPRFVAD